MPTRDPLNLFSPYERLPAGHENQLTRALLLLLRMSPLVHTEWMRLIAPERALPDLLPVEFDTQTRSPLVAGDANATQLISVFLAPDVEQVADEGIVQSGRVQILDGVINYDDDLVVVIENKVFEADDRQARELNLQGTGVEIEEGKRPVRLSWRNVLDRLIRLRESGLASGTEAAVLDDFLAYVEDHFEDLGPCRTLALCQRVRTRLLRRLRAILGDAAGLSAQNRAHGACVAAPGHAAAIRDIYLRVTEEDEIELALYPGDTLEQARAFYHRPEALLGLKNLANREGWEARPNFHFGHMERGFCWATGEIQLDSYLDIWAERISQASRIPRAEWDSYWDWLIDTGIARSEDRWEFDKHFTITQRQTASPRPGVWLARRWPLEEAESMDSRRELACSVRESLDAALNAIGEPALAE